MLDFHDNSSTDVVCRTALYESCLLIVLLIARAVVGDLTDVHGLPNDV